MNGGSYAGSDAPPRPSEASSQLTYFGRHSTGYIEHSAELEQCYFSDSSLFHSSLIREFTDSTKIEPSVPRHDMFLLDVNQNQGSDSSSGFISGLETEEELVTPGWPLMHHTIGFDKVKPVLECFSQELVLARRSLDNVKPAPSPTHRLSIEKVHFKIILTCL